MRKKIHRIPVFIILLLGVLCIESFAQKIVCKVKVNLEKMPYDNQAKLTYLQEELETYINRYNWSEDEFKYDLNCEMELAFTEAKSVAYEDQYTASIIVSNGVDLLYSDKRCTFALEENERLVHSTAFHPLAGVIDFYFFLILAYEYDKLYEFGGDDYYDLVHQITISAKSAPQKYFRGWDRRGDLVKDLQSESNKRFRRLLYHYFTGYYFYQEKDYEGAKPHLSTAVKLLRRIPIEKLSRFLELNYTNFYASLKRLKLGEQAKQLESFKPSDE